MKTPREVGVEVDAPRAPSLRTDEPRYFTLAELYARPELLLPPAAVIAPFAYAGRVTLISGREKAGKSTMVGQAVAALSRGDELWGVPLPQQSTLWIGLDEPLGDTVRRFNEMGADAERVTITSDRPDANQLRERLGDECPALVVVDTLTELLPGANFNRPETFLSSLRRYIDTVREFDVALVLLYHASKSRGEYIGDVRLGGAVDAPLTLDRPNRGNSGETTTDDEADDGRRLLKGRPRWPSPELRLRLQYSEGQYVLAGSPPTLDARLLLALADGAEVSANKLVAMVRGNRAGVLDALHKLNDTGMIESPRRGAWRLVSTAARGQDLFVAVPDKRSSRHPKRLAGTDE
jgi:hypothetical protein